MPEETSRATDPTRSAAGIEGADALCPDETPCADEDIRVPGSIQPQGFLLGVDPGVEIVTFASENAADFLNSPVKLILGSTLDLFLDRELLASIRQLRCAIDPDGLVTYLGAFRVGGELCSVLTHCVEGHRVLEFERQERLVGSEMMNSVMTNFVSLLSQVENEEDLCQAITRQVRDLTKFDRVLLYSFDAAGHGTVLAEENNGVLPSYLNLRFPATDIPPQARALYISNTVRIIPNANYAPIPLRGLARQTPLDMSLCVLRSVSPTHLEYMRNMGTMASMSLSIVVEGRLWGLISGHHAEPRAVPYLIRSACDMLTRMVGTQLNALRTASRLRTTVRFHDVQRRMLTQMAAENDYVNAISRQMPSLMQITDAAGAVLAVDDHFDCIGETPDSAVLLRLLDWLESRADFEIFESHHLASEIPWAQESAGAAAGLLAIRISDVRRRFVLWFRPEVIRTVQWAGEPVKLVGPGRRLHPRTSFASWQETLRGHSVPWSAVEIESAREFRNAVTTISLRRAEEEAQLSEARFHKLTHTLPLKIFVVTDEGLLTYVNARWKDAGLGEEGLWYDPHRVAPADASRCAQSWRTCVAEEREFEEEIRLRDADGAEHDNLVRVVPFRREGARRAGWIGVCIDLTERKQREAAMRVSEKLALTGRMTSYLAHEINNPLEAITNLLFLLRHSAPQDAESSNYISMVEAELERISGTVKQTLRWNSETSDKKALITVGLIFEDVLRLLGSKIRNRHIQVELEGDLELQIFGIEGQMRQVVAHLVSNSLDAVAVGGTVRLGAQPSASGIEITVADDGIGMTEDELASLFKPFYSTKGDLGNGLGLYIAKEIAERHQGSFEVTSEKGSGTTVRLQIPESLSQ